MALVRCGVEPGRRSGVDAAGSRVPSSRRGTVALWCCSSWAVAMMPFVPNFSSLTPRG